ncbi:MAG: hypothetical protein DME22_05895 [Verrucomicrobia bacterium]|nr:MAG: hypothetical protein DME22_05895 [Verrucomicrobiota bacterium]PYJ97337.1 MAG: hypothetical protein DME23_16035 [Verrucomicrobiota bacterium]
MFARFFRWLFSWKTLRRALLSLVGLFTLIALLVTEENWRGKRAWENFKREWEAKGERFDLAAFMPKPVPDDQNFVMTPFFAPVREKERRMASGDWRDTNVLQSTLDIYGSVSNKRAPLFGNLKTGKLTDLLEWQKFYLGNTNFPSIPQPQTTAKDVLFALEKFGPVLKQLREVSHRPYAQFPLYQDKDPMLPLIHLSNLKSVASVLRLRATAFLADDQSEESLQDVKVILRLADSLKPEPFLISHLARLSVLEISVNPVWEGLARHQWSAPELLDLQRLLGSIELLADYEHIIRGERAGSNNILAWLRSGRRIPSGLLYQNQIRIDRFYQLRALPLVDAGLHRLYPGQCNQLTNLPEFRKKTLYNFLAPLLLPSIGGAVKTAHEQAVLDQAAVACALERYRLALGQYPETLDALIPQFIEKLPTDVVGGQPLRYRHTDDGQFVLYSVGWNEKDDGGVIAYDQGKTLILNDNRGDWVWRYPTNR